MVSAVHFRSETDDWATPQHVYDHLHVEFGFTLDVCASAANAKCARYFTKEQDGLRQTWDGVVWMNPPYGRTIGRWTGKAREAAAQGATVVGLVPARTDAAWWHRDVMSAVEVRLIAGRLCFGRSGIPAPFPSAVIVWRPGTSAGPVLSGVPRDVKWNPIAQSGMFKESP